MEIETNDGKEIKTTVLTSLQTIFRFVFVTTVGAVVADSALNWGVVRDLRGDNERNIVWVSQHKQQYDSLVHALTLQDLQGNGRAEKIQDLSDELRGLMDRLRVAERQISVIRATTSRED